ncbi:hypothetical protein Tco_1492959 [Tanacetum coccineum]
MKPKSIAQARRNMIKYLKNQGNFKITDFKGMSYNDIRPIFEKLWDFNQNIVPMDEEKGSKKQKSPEKERTKSPEKERSTEKIVEEEAVTQEEREEVVKEPATKRKKSIPRKTTRKRQKLEEDADKDELKRFLDIVPREEAPIEIESLSTKFPIVDWKTVVLTETFMYYQVFRGDGSSKNYKVLSEMLEDFDRMDVEELFRLVKERYSTSAPEGFDLMLWGDLHTLFEHDEDDEIWRDQHEYNLLSWRLCDFCGIHILLMDNGLAIHMLTEKKYPLSQEMLSKMLSRKLEVDHESSHAFELLRFIRAELDMKSMQDQVRASVIPYKTDQDILDEVELDRILRQKDQEAELLRKQTAEAQQRAYLAALKADAAHQNSETMYRAIGEYFSYYAPNPTHPFMPPAFARPTMPQLSPEWAHLLNPPFPYNQPLQPSYAGPSQYTGPPRYTAPLQPL